jgi:hypothetical protein
MIFLLTCQVDGLTGFFIVTTYIEKLRNRSALVCINEKTRTVPGSSRSEAIL